MKKLRFDFTLEIYVSELGNPLLRLPVPLAQLSDFLTQLPVEVLAQLPTGAITGKQPGGLDPGWMWVVRISEAD